MNIAKGSEQNIHAIIEAYEHQLYGYLRKILICHESTKDVLQEVFLRIWINLEKFRGDSELSTWIYRIAHNEALRFIDKEKKRLEALGSSLENDLLNKLESDEYISGNEIQMKLQKAILTLSSRQREVFTMRYFDEMKYDKIAEILEVSVNNLKVNYHKAKQKIEEQLKL